MVAFTFLDDAEGGSGPTEHMGNDYSLYGYALMGREGISYITCRRPLSTA